jgi:hypothetical protein
VLLPGGGPSALRLGATPYTYNVQRPSGMVIMHMAVQAQPPCGVPSAETAPSAPVSQSLTASVVYQLSEAGRKACLLAGGDGLTLWAGATVGTVTQFAG